MGYDNDMTTHSPHSFRLLLIAAAISFLPMINLYYVGEEAIFPITSLEMWQHDTWLKQYLYGNDVKHNPLFNWLIMVFANLTGWSHVMEVARVLTICATFASTAVLYWLSLRLFKDPGFAAFAALVYLTMSDVLMYHGWLAYVDPLFAMFIFAAIATLWVACAEQRQNLLWIAAIALTCAFLSKAFTAYVFYGSAVLVLLRDKAHRKLLLGPISLAAHTTMLLAPFVWFSLIPSGRSQSGRMFDEILYKLSFPEAGAYLKKLLVYPLEIWAVLLPAGALVIYFALRKRINDIETQPTHFRNALFITGLCFLPYWLAPQSGVRYIMPIFPLMALVTARLIWRAGSPAINTTRRWLAGTIALNFLLGLVVFPYYQHIYRGENHSLAASDILTRTQGHTIFISDSTTNGLNVAAYINQQRYPHQALQYPPESFESGFIISRTGGTLTNKPVKEYKLGGDKLYLLCRGAACDAGLPIK